MLGLVEKPECLYLHGNYAACEDSDFVNSLPTYHGVELSRVVASFLCQFQKSPNNNSKF